MALRPPETTLSSPALKLSGKGPKEGEWAKFGWQLAFGNINATFFSGSKEGSNESRFLNVKVKPEYVQVFCNELIQAAQDGPYTAKEISLFGGKPGARQLTGKIIIGKEDDGTIWTTIHKEGLHKTKFQLTYPPDIKIGVLGGGELSRAEISSRRARSYAETLSRTALMVYQENFDPNEGNSFGKPRAGGGEGSAGISDDDVPPGW